MQPVLRLDSVSKTFPGVRALDGVRFDVRPGEVHALLGENGAGKSTLIKIMSGVHQPDAGTLQLDGKPVRFAEPAGGPAGRHRHDLPGAAALPRAHRGREHLRRSCAAAALGRHRLEPDARAAAEILASLDIHDLDVGPHGGCPLGREPPAGRDRQGAVAERTRPDHGRADGGPDRGRRRAPVRHRAPAEGPRRGHRLYQPPAGRGLRACRPGHRAARRPACRHPRRWPRRARTS